MKRRIEKRRELKDAGKSLKRIRESVKNERTKNGNGFTKKGVEDERDTQREREREGERESN